MAVNLEAVRAQVKILLKYKDLTVLPNADQDDLIQKALVRYSRIKPVLTVTEYTGNSTGIYSLVSPWVHGFSQVLEIEYPTGKTPKEIIEDKNISIDKTPTGWVLRFDEMNPGSGNNFWLKYNCPHTSTSDGVLEDMPETDQAPFEYLCAGLMAEALSNHFASKANPTLPGTELVTYNERVREYSDKAKEWFKLFNDEVKPDVTGLVGSSDFLSTTFFDRESL